MIGPGCFGLKCTQMASGEDESVFGLQGYKWHAQVLVETDIFNLQCTDRVSLDGLSRSLWTGRSLCFTATDDHTHFVMDVTKTGQGKWVI